MNYPKCPYCGKSDGNDDIVISRKLNYVEDQECKFVVEKQCDICGKRYHIGMTYEFTYWKYEE